MNKDTSKSKRLFINLGVALLAYLLMIIIGQHINLPFSGYTLQAVGELLLVIAYLAAAFIVKKQDCLKFKTTGFGISIVIALFLLLRIGMGLFQFISQSIGTAFITVPAIEVISTVLLAFFVGIAEETLFRGVIQGSLHDYFGTESQGSVRWAIILASVIFGCVHFVNIFTMDVDFYSVLVQVISAAGTGLIFGTMYYRSGMNLWTGIILHAVNDLISFVMSGAFEGGTLSDSVSATTSAVTTSKILPLIVTLVFTLIYLLVCFGFTGKKAVKKLAEKAD